MIRIYLLALLLSGAVYAEVAVPPLTERVTDLTGTLDAQQKQTLESRLAAFEAKKGAQLAVLLVPTTQPEAIEQYSLRVVEAWKLGRKKVDDGALLIVAKDDRALRIEVGYGLEGVLNDATANRIVEEIIVPQFKRGDFFGGVDAGTAAMIQLIEGELLPPPAQRAAATGGKSNLETLLFIGFALVVVVGGVLRSLFGRFPAALLVGGGLGLLAWWMVVPIFMAVLAGLGAFMLVLLGGAGRGFGGFGGGGLGGGFGGGGFGGGGGGFGGGGASGRW